MSSWLTKRIARLCSLAMGNDMKPYSEWADDPRLSLEFIVTDARALPIHPNAIDFIIATSFLEHVPR